MALALFAPVVAVRSADLPAPVASAGPAEISAPSKDAPIFETAAARFNPLLRPDSIYFFGGALSTTALGSTLLFNLDQPASIKRYDNNIVGAAYSHDFYRIGYGFTFGLEVGVADRFGRYAICCRTTVLSSDYVHSAELWVGPRVSYDGFVLFNTLRIGGAVTWGASLTSNSIGIEKLREISNNGNARALVYVGPEIVLSLVEHPEWEFVYRETHRSGTNGTFGKLREGYNANVFGLRYRF